MKIKFILVLIVSFLLLAVATNTTSPTPSPSTSPSNSHLDTVLNNTLYTVDDSLPTNVEADLEPSDASEVINCILDDPFNSSFTLGDISESSFYIRLDIVLTTVRS